LQCAQYLSDALKNSAAKWHKERVSYFLRKSYNKQAKKMNEAQAAVPRLDANAILFNNTAFVPPQSTNPSSPNASSNAVPYQLGNMLGNIFYNHCCNARSEHRITDNDPLREFAEHTWVKLHILPEFTDDILRNIGQLYFRDVFHVQTPGWSDMELQWLDFVKVTKTPRPEDDDVTDPANVFTRFNIYVLHSHNISPYIQGPTFVEFMKNAEELVSSLDRETAVRYAELMYTLFFKTLVAENGRNPFRFPPWNREMFEDYFYNIRLTDKVIKKQDEHIVRRIRKRNLEFTEAMQDKLDEIMDGTRYNSIAQVSAALRAMFHIVT
jgi:hypothetical protein